MSLGKGFWAFLVIIIILGCAGCDVGGGRSHAPESKPSISEEVARGKELYLSYGCAVCHGKDGDGKGMSSDKLAVRPTNFNNLNAYRYGRDKGMIRNAIRLGGPVAGSAMPSFKHIPPDELEALSEFIVSLQEKKPVSGNGVSDEN